MVLLRGRQSYVLRTMSVVCARVLCCSKKIKMFAFFLGCCFMCVMRRKANAQNNQRHDNHIRQ